MKRIAGAIPLILFVLLPTGGHAQKKPKQSAPDSPPPVTDGALPEPDKPAATQLTTPDDPLPDPATVNVPDVTPPTDPIVRADGYKFYYFHNPAVTFAEAYRDFAECRPLMFSGAIEVPTFLEWTRKPPTHRHSAQREFRGLLAEAVLPKIARGMQSNVMRRCMGVRGYVRYAIPQAVFEQINTGAERDIVLIQAKLASGPRPNDAAVTR